MSLRSARTRCGRTAFSSLQQRQRHLKQQQQEQLFVSTAAALVLCSLVLRTTLASPVFVDNPSLARFQSARNIRHHPCNVRKSGRPGICMFAIDCIKRNGTHLGTCIDRFYFGSCCQVQYETPFHAPEISDNSIDQNTISHFVHESTTLLTNALFKLTTESSSHVPSAESSKNTTSVDSTHSSTVSHRSPSRPTVGSSSSKPISNTTPSHKNSQFMARTTTRTKPPPMGKPTIEPTTIKPQKRKTPTRPPLLTTAAIALPQVDEERTEFTTPSQKLFTIPKDSENLLTTTETASKSKPASAITTIAATPTRKQMTTATTTTQEPTTTSSFEATPPVTVAKTTTAVPTVGATSASITTTTTPTTSRPASATWTNSDSQHNVTFADCVTTTVSTAIFFTKPNFITGPSSTDVTTSTTSTSTTTSSKTTEDWNSIPENMYERVDYRQICGRRMLPEPRIVGGSNAAFGRWPWQISLSRSRHQLSTYTHNCGAALLNENWAITAAHCVDNFPPADLLLRLGEYDIAGEEEPYSYQERRVQIVASHPQFDPWTFEYDLALLRFYEPIVFQPNIIPICVPESDYDFIGQTAFVTGWGRLYEDGPLPSVLQEVAVSVINNTVCETMYRAAGYIEHLPHIFICAGWKKGGHDSCEADSGGPMVVEREEDKRFQLAGVVSWGIGCGEPNQPGLYTRISEFRDWINQILQV